MKSPNNQSEQKAGLHSDSEVRNCAVLIVDIAGTVELRSRVGEAVAGEKISNLLAEIVAAAEMQGGEFIKSYGDDVMVLFGQEPKLARAARVAVQAQQLARDAGLKLYAAVHAGEVEFRQTMGHPDALGQAINITARLHKLTENAPGRIFLTASHVRQLPAELQALCSAFGSHHLKGVGAMEVWTLDWRDDESGTQTVFSRTAAHESDDMHQLRQTRLSLRHGINELMLDAASGRCIIGRSADAQLSVLDPEVRVSSLHVQLESASGHWFVQDVSRNGTWLFDERVQEETILPKGHPFSLPPKGRLCLGRPFREDAEQRFVVAFEMLLEEQ